MLSFSNDLIGSDGFVKDRLCRFYGLVDNTPKDWQEMKSEFCPSCLSPWNDPTCGPKKELDRGHYIGTHCYGRYFTEPFAQRKCPVCGIPLLTPETQILRL